VDAETERVGDVEQSEVGCCCDGKVLETSPLGG